MTIAKKQLLAGFIITIFSLLLISSALPVQADNSLIKSQTGLNEIGQVYGNKIPQDIRITIARVINIALGFLGIIFLALTIFAGFQYMMAGGNEEKVKKATSLLTNAIIGLVIILVAWAITRFSIIILGKAINNSVDYQTYYPFN